MLVKLVSRVLVFTFEMITVIFACNLHVFSRVDFMELFLILGDLLVVSYFIF